MTDEEDNPGHVTPDLCAAYREALKGEIKDLKGDMEKIEGRTWKILAGVIVTILLAIVSIAVSCV